MKPGTKEAGIRKDERREGVACREGRANLETLLRHSAKRTTSRERERRGVAGGGGEKKVAARGNGI